jgi:hypothetical protein
MHGCYTLCVHSLHPCMWAWMQHKIDHCNQVSKHGCSKLFLSSYSVVDKLHTEKRWAPTAHAVHTTIFTHARAWVRASRAILYVPERAYSYVRDATVGCDPARTYVQLIPAARVEPLIGAHPSSSPRPQLHPISLRPQPPGVSSLRCLSAVAAPPRRFVPPSCAARATTP